MTKTLKSIISSLDFSGGTNSWFDLWHTHLDWDGAANQSWPLRRQHLEQLLQVYQQLSIKLQAYPHPYQLWIEIDEQEAGEDAVYIHTPNPNADNFPIQYASLDLPQFENQELKQFVCGLNLSIKGIKTQDGNVYFLYDENIGMTL